MADKIRFGIIGCGQRGVGAYGKLLTETFSKEAVLCALADSNYKRLEAAVKLLNLQGVAVYRDYRELLQDDSIEAVVVATPDFTHEEIAVDALKAGKQVLCEKPIATTVEGCQKILSAVSPGQVLAVGFVLRYNRVFTTAKRLIEEGVIGTVKQIAATDNRQGADYFRRWHRFREKSGGLFNHKSGHLLDIVNWFAGGTPVRVAALGGVTVFNPGEWQGERCLTCDNRNICPEYYDLTKEPLNSLYLQAESVDGYIRDTCVFTSEKTTIDHGTALIEYDNSVKASYNLALYAPLDTRQVMVFGDKGKLELDEAERIIRIRLRHSDDVMEYKVGAEEGGHGGGDIGLMREFIDCVRKGAAPLADAVTGALSCLVSLAAEESVHNGGFVSLLDMVRQADAEPQLFRLV
ncbi:MAG: Gfo/Idh/MocA family oxidoreductase [Firmicutes bacterium]|nr:Gfo/Idh/MocA family oxidoreductase [Bacillota bacterium]